MEKKYVQIFAGNILLSTICWNVNLPEMHKHSQPAVAV